MYIKKFIDIFKIFINIYEISMDIMNFLIKLLKIWCGYFDENFHKNFSKILKISINIIEILFIPIWKLNFIWIFKKIYIYFEEILKIKFDI